MGGTREWEGQGVGGTGSGRDKGNEWEGQGVGGTGSGRGREWEGQGVGGTGSRGREGAGVRSWGAGNGTRGLVHVACLPRSGENMIDAVIENATIITKTQ